MTTSPAWVAVVSAHYIVYSLPAWAVVAWRCARLRFSRREIAVLAIFLGALAMEAAQLAAEGFEFGKRGATWGLPRYFGVFAPLLWLWTAHLLAVLWGRFKGVRGVAVRIAVLAALGWILAMQNILPLEKYYNGGARKDAVGAARRAARVIRWDYAGPARQERTIPAHSEYITTRRPVVFGDFAAAAWFVRGQSEGALQGYGMCPYECDYLFFRVGTGYGGVAAPDTSNFDFVCKIPGGLGAEWRLFRRKGVPHK